MWFVPDLNVGTAESDGPTIAEAARQRLVFQHMNLDERTAVADLFEGPQRRRHCPRCPNRWDTAPPARPARHT